MALNRRYFLFLVGASAGAFVLDACASAKNSEQPSSTITAATPKPTTPSSRGAIQLPALPYAFNALEPHIDTATMRFHHDKHHATYVKNLNTALDKYPQLKSRTVEDLLRNLNSVPQEIRTTVRNNGGGHVNHSMFWRIMKPKGGGAPTGAIATAIKQNFGSFAEFKKQFNEAGSKRFGSGWVWLARNPNGKLEIMSTANQDTPLMEGKYPIMGNDVWEHAYYLKYQNRRADYLNSWWNVVNWDEINRRYAIAQKV
ncbi:MAG: superoxide dismutase [Fischerella sp.]|jgi:Fe-Mn family superoxide dismutase|uniref:superoxide dismutase n=1 Tax=Fischerella sp. TaxID=1191 RepID=UPI0017EA39FA|nr:superoxide dismutase [Fischerella sp.]NWF60326.1 superoxide dismutase [Fischerella sp.]